MSFSNKLYVTFIDHEFDGDVFFPEIDASGWQEVSREKYAPDAKNPYPYSFAVFERKNPAAKRAKETSCGKTGIPLPSQ